MTPDHPQKITFGEMRASGVRDVLVYCRDHRCSHDIAISADLWPLVAPKNKSLACSNKTGMRCSGSNASPAEIPNCGWWWGRLSPRNAV
jgi:hypothetical protein